MKGSHLMSYWARTQQVIALSSAEAELNAICKAAQEGLGSKQFAEELDCHEELEVKTDAAAAIGITLRQGTGRIKHLEVKQLWVQEKVTAEKMKIVEVP